MGSSQMRQSRSLSDISLERKLAETSAIEPEGIRHVNETLIEGNKATCRAQAKT